MRNRWNFLAGLVVCLLVLAPSLARALSLADVNGSSETYSAEGSTLSFSDFEVTVTGNQDLDLDLIEIVFEEDGFRLIGPMVVTGSNLLDVVLDYTVSSTERIVAVELAFTGFAAGGDSSASIAETIDEFPEVALGVFDTADGTLTRDSASLGEGATTLHITKDILLASVEDSVQHDNGNHYGWERGKHLGWDGDVPPGWQRHGFDEDGKDDDCDDKGDDCDDKGDDWCRWKRLIDEQGGIAHVSVIEQRFTTEPGPIPEPASVLLLVLGLGGLAALRCRRTA